MRLLTAAFAALAFATQQSFAFTADEVAKLVRERNLQVLAAKEQLKGALFQEKATKKSFLPQLTLSGSFFENYQSAFPKGWQQSYTLSATVTDQLVNFQQLDQLKIDRTQVEIQKANLSGTLLEQLYQALNLFLEAGAQREKVKIRKELLNSAQQIFKVAQKKYREGLVMVTDLLKAKAEVDSAKRALVEEENRYRKTLNRLNELLNTRLKGEPEVCFFTEELKINRKELLKRALSLRPELKQQEKGVKLSKLQVQQIQDTLKPSLNLSVSVSRTGTQFLPSDKTVSAGITINFPVFDSGVTKARALSAESGVKVAQLQLQELKNRIKREVLNAVADVESGYQRLKAAESSLNFYRKAYSRSLNEYRLGVTDIVSLLQAFNALKNGEEEYIDALLSYNQAILNLDRTTGQLLTGGFYEEVSRCSDSFGTTRSSGSSDKGEKGARARSRSGSNG
ncbi:TolC family protein [Thermovibrio ammonificans]